MAKAAFTFSALDAADLSKLIKSVKTASSKLNTQIQLAAINCVAHAVLHGDVRPATQLMDAAGKGIRRASLLAWFEMHGPFAWSENAFKLYDKDGFIATRLTSMNSTLDEYCTALFGKPWAEAKPEPKLVSSKDAVDVISKMLAKLVKEHAAGDVTIDNFEVVEQLNSTLAKFTASMADVELPAVKAA